jgi:type IV secretion system protein VirB9
MAAVPVECAPLRTTDIQLEPGETVTGVAMGDSERWMATPAASGDPTNPTPHIVVKPQMAGLATDLTIFTTHHIYRLSLRSRPGGAKQSVSFYFPDEILTAMRAADTAPARNDPTNTLVADSSARLAGSPNAADPTAPTVDPSRLNFAYQINGPALPWRPTRVFDDGTRTWIEMPPSTSPIAPALLGDNHAALNYRVIGNHYVANSRAAARAIPEPAPVIKATLPSRRAILSFLRIQMLTAGARLKTAAHNHSPGWRKILVSGRFRIQMHSSFSSH